MTARSPIVKVELTEEEKRLAPDWEEQKEIFQSNCDSRARDLSQRFRIVLHEGSHAVQYRNQFGWDVAFHGPSLDFEDGKLQFVLGAVSPIRTNNYKPFDWQDAMVSTSSFLLVERFTGLPDKQAVIQNDLKGLRKLGEQDMNRAVHYAEIMLEDQLSDPNFIRQLEQACRDYEMDVYGTDEATTWGWQQYRPELPGERRSVRLISHAHGLLITNGAQLRLFSNGNEVVPSDGVRLQLVSYEQRTLDAIRRWNELVSGCNGTAKNRGTAKSGNRIVRFKHGTRQHDRYEQEETWQANG